jgi:hypothetical protein
MARWATPRPLFATVLWAFAVSAIKITTDQLTPAVSTKYLVEFDHSSSLLNSPRDELVRLTYQTQTFSHIGVQPHSAIFKSFEDQGVRFTVKKKYNTQGVFVGAAITVSVS